MDLALLIESAKDPSKIQMVLNMHIPHRGLPKVLECVLNLFGRIDLEVYLLHLRVLLDNDLCIR